MAITNEQLMGMIIKEIVGKQNTYYSLNDYLFIQEVKRTYSVNHNFIPKGGEENGKSH